MKLVGNAGLETVPYEFARDPLTTCSCSTTKFWNFKNQKLNDSGNVETNVYSMSTSMRVTEDDEMCMSYGLPGTPLPVTVMCYVAHYCKYRPKMLIRRRACTRRCARFIKRRIFLIKPLQSAWSPTRRTDCLVNRETMPRPRHSTDEHCS